MDFSEQASVGGHAGIMSNPFESDLSDRRTGQIAEALVNPGNATPAVNGEGDG